MQPQAPAAPTKLFREEAQTGSVGCPACGGPITLEGFGAIEQVTCPYCGSDLDPQDSGELQIVQQAQRQRRQSALPLHVRGTLDGHEWELIGIVWRECRVDGVVYPWQEFLLFNPYQGYRYLVFQMTDGTWMLGGALSGAPRVETGFGHRKVSFQKAKYKHFQSSVAIVSYVEGEFPWQVRVGDKASAHDYVAPPICVSIEETAGEEGADVNFTRMRHIEPAEVWKAFKAPGSPPRTSGVGMLVPNPWKKGRAFTWILFAVLFVLWGLMSLVYVGGRSNRVVYSNPGVTALTPIAEDIVVEGPGKTALEFEFNAYNLSNAWAYAEVVLIPQDSENAIGFGATAEEWHGVSGGESWREGNQRPSVIIGGVPEGKYLLQITPSAGQQGAAQKTPPPNLRMDFFLKQDIVLARYIMLPLVIILAFPIFFFIFSRAFEVRRWSNSDYVSSN